MSIVFFVEHNEPVEKPVWMGMNFERSEKTVKWRALLDEAATRQTGLDRFCSSMINML